MTLAGVVPADVAPGNHRVEDGGFTGGVACLNVERGGAGLRLSYMRGEVRGYQFGLGSWGRRC